MKKNKPFSLQERIKSISYALNGIKSFFKEEHNARVHLTATIIAVIFCFLFSVSKTEIIALTISIAFVWAAELFNTAVEKMMDFVSTERHTSIKNIKDLAAGAVLVAAISAVITGLIVFVPKL
jgi:diacylglycerol kinase (ATP)